MGADGSAAGFGRQARPTRACAALAPLRWAGALALDSEGDSDGDSAGPKGGKRKAPKGKGKGRVATKRQCSAQGTAEAGGEEGKKAKKGKPKKGKGEAAPADAPAVSLRSPVAGLPPAVQQAKLGTSGEQGLRAGACLALRHHIAAAGTALKSGLPPAVTPLPSATPFSVVLTQAGVVPLLRRAVALGREAAARAADSGDAAGSARATATADTTAALVTALGAARGERGGSLGTTALFNSHHPPLVKLLRKRRCHGVVPGEPVFTGAGIRITFPVVRLLRRVERRGKEVRPGRLYSWHGKGAGWLRPAPAPGKNGAGLVSRSTDWRAWRCLTPGGYSPDGVPQGWQPWMDGCNVAVLDPGAVLIVCEAGGRALSKREYYRFQKIWNDFLPRPAAVRGAEAALGRDGGPAQSPGLLAFLRYAAAFHRAYPTLQSYYGSPARARARELKGDRLRSLLDQLLTELAPGEADVIAVGGNYSGVSSTRKGTRDGAPVLQVGACSCPDSTVYVRCEVLFSPHLPPLTPGAPPPLPGLPCALCAAPPPHSPSWRFCSDAVGLFSWWVVRNGEGHCWRDRVCAWGACRVRRGLARLGVCGRMWVGPQGVLASRLQWVRPACACGPPHPPLPPPPYYWALRMNSGLHSGAVFVRTRTASWWTASATARRFAGPVASSTGT